MAGEASCSAFFGFVPIKPSIEGDFPKMSEVKEGGEFVLSAKVDGSPPPTAIWLCEGEPVKADGQRIIITEEEAEDGSGIITTLRFVGGDPSQWPQHPVTLNHIIYWLIKLLFPDLEKFCSCSCLPLLS